MINIFFFLMLGAELIAAVSQVLLKKSAQKEHGSFIREYVNPFVIGGYGLLVISMMLTIYCNKGLEYMTAVLMESMSYIMVMIMSRLVFKEKITRYKFIGMCLIMLGIVTFNLG